MAFVFEDRQRSALSGVINAVVGSISAKTGVAPARSIPSTESPHTQQEMAQAEQSDLAEKLLTDCGLDLAPQVGLEPTTLRLTAGCSAIELLRIAGGQTRWVL